MFWWGKASSSPPLAIVGPPVALNSFSSSGVVFIPTAPGFKGLVTDTNTYHAGIDNSRGSPFDSDIPAVFGVGTRTSLGTWLSEDVGVEGRYLALARSSETNTAGGGGRVIALPYIDANTGLPASYIVNAPYAQTGLTSVMVNTTPDTFVGLYNTAKLRRSVPSGSRCRTPDPACLQMDHESQPSSRRRSTASSTSAARATLISKGSSASATSSSMKR